MRYYSPSSRSFYVRGLHAEIPVDAMEISEAEHAALLAGRMAGRSVVIGADGRPTLEVAAAYVAPPLTHDQVDALRRKAYADAQTGSDRLYIDYQRCLAVGDADGAEMARQAWLDRAVEIQEQYPWPEVA